MMPRKQRIKWLRRLRRISGDMIGLLGLAALFVLAGCFSLRTTAMIPSNLRFMTLTTDHVFHEITANLTRRMNSAGINTRNRLMSTVIVKLHDSTPSTEVPVIFDSLQGTVYRYRMQVGLELSCRNGKVFYQTTLSANQDILHNINQVSPPVLTPLMRRALIQRLVDSTMYLITRTDLSHEVSQQCQPSAPRSSSASR